MLNSLRVLIGLPSSRYIQIVLYKVYADLAAEVERFYVGYLWWFIEPISEMIVYYVVFGVLLERGTPDFVPFLLIGLVMWKWFQSSVGISSNAIVGNRRLLFQVYVPKVIFPATTVIANTVKFLVVYFVLLSFLILYGFKPCLSWLSLPIILLSCFTFISAISFLAASLIPFYRDLKVLIESVLRLMFFASGIFFPMSTIPEKYRIYVIVNPMAIYISEMRRILMHGQWPDWFLLGMHGASSLVVFCLACYVIKRLDQKYPKVV